MKILRIYTRLPPLIGGMEIHIAQLTKEQIKLGHDVKIYFNKGIKVTSEDVQVAKLNPKRKNTVHIAKLLRLKILCSLSINKAHHYFLEEGRPL